MVLLLGMIILRCGRSIGRWLAPRGAAPRRTRICLVNARGNQIDPCARLKRSKHATLFCGKWRETPSMALDRRTFLRNVIRFRCREFAGGSPVDAASSAKMQKSPAPRSQPESGVKSREETPRARRPTGIQRLNLPPVAPMVGGSDAEKASARGPAEPMVRKRIYLDALRSTRISAKTSRRCPPEATADQRIHARWRRLGALHGRLSDCREELISARRADISPPAREPCR